jgi:hypothetical protein
MFIVFATRVHERSPLFSYVCFVAHLLNIGIKHIFIPHFYNRQMHYARLLSTDILSSGRKCNTLAYRNLTTLSPSINVLSINALSWLRPGENCNLPTSKVLINGPNVSNARSITWSLCTPSECSFI